jgi:hypothetical protein
MSEMSELYKVPAPEEINDLLKGDFGVDEAAPEKHPPLNSAPAQDKILEVGDRSSKVLEVQKLLNELYLDFHHINRVAQSAFDEAEDNNPQAVCTMLGLIESQCDRSISKIERNQP